MWCCECFSVFFSCNTKKEVHVWFSSNKLNILFSPRLNFKGKFIGWAAGALKGHTLFFYYLFLQVLRWMAMVLKYLDPKVLQVLEMKEKRRRLLQEALDGLHLRFSGSNSSCLGKKSGKPATWNASNVPNKMLKEKKKLGTWMINIKPKYLKNLDLLKLKL